MTPTLTHTINHELIIKKKFKRKKKSTIFNKSSNYLFDIIAINTSFKKISFNIDSKSLNNEESYYMKVKIP